MSTQFQETIKRVQFNKGSVQYLCSLFLLYDVQVRMSYPIFMFFVPPIQCVVEDVVSNHVFFVPPI